MSPRRSGCRALPSQGSLAQSSSRASTFQPTAALASPGTQKPLEISTARHMPSLERLLVAGKPCHFDCFQMGIMAEMQSANLHSSAAMMKQLAAAVCTVYGISYSGYYYLTNLASHVIRAIRRAHNETAERAAVFVLASFASEEEAKEEEIDLKDYMDPVVLREQLEQYMRSSEAVSVSALASSASEEEAKEEEIEMKDCMDPVVLTEQLEQSMRSSEAVSVSALASSASEEEAKEEEIEMKDCMIPAVVTAELGQSMRSSEAVSVSALASSASEEETKEEEIDLKDCMDPVVLTAELGQSMRVLLELEHEQTVLSEMPCQTQGELFPAQHQEKQLGQQVEEPQENGQNMKAEPQAELPEAQSDIKAVKSRNKEDMRSSQEEMTLHEQRGDQQKQNIKEQLQAELQETEARINAREKRLEEEMKIIRETLNPLSQALQKQVEVLTCHLAACRGFEQTTGSEEPQDRREAQELSHPEVLQLGHDRKMYKGSLTKAAAAAAASSTGAFAPQPEKRSPGSRFISSTDTAAAQQQEIKDDSLELLRCIVTTANPMTKYIELENIGSGTFGEVCRALDTATGGEVNVNSAADSAALEGFPLCCELELWVELC
ncbi:hypothetical protein DUI87_22230 [Hirundo rustica rustica]|uniref:Protein kinase domain-containing protein n=1 Tax=Hirundo rustica rustica TaxID=333673 RepID=A0A3M0JLV6_HIRRU|nr:hypothetical protein DUI87_22230 [Hirundo rustica rustica]